MQVSRTHCDRRIIDLAGTSPACWNSAANIKDGKGTQDLWNQQLELRCLQPPSGKCFISSRDAQSSLSSQAGALAAHIPAATSS